MFKNTKKNKLPIKEIKSFSTPRPLFIGCSGGGGHNAAILAIIGGYKKNEIIFTTVTPKPYHAVVESRGNNLQTMRMSLGVKVTNYPVINALLAHTSVPILPKSNALDIAINNIEINNKSKRNYVDMLLDVYPMGYENVAIWNELQQHDVTQELAKLVALQNISDNDNYYIVKKYFLTELEKPGSMTGDTNHQSPYTEIISTQAMALPSLCDAFIEYNEKNNTQIKIKQYMTDIASKGAVHFFPVLASLTDKQKEQMELYGVNLNKSICEKFNLSSPPFKKIENITPENNPMVRPGFKLKPTEPDSTTGVISLPIQQETNDDLNMTIKNNDRVAAVMLGSQAGKDTIEYVNILQNKGYDKIFVFAGPNQKKFQDAINLLQKNNPNNQSEIIVLGKQDDFHIAPIMMRSNCIITRAGGLSVMEQMAMHSNMSITKDKMIFIHHKESYTRKLSSGILWEDYNANALIKFLRKLGITVKKTSIQRLALQLDNVPNKTLLTHLLITELELYKTKKNLYQKKHLPKNCNAFFSHLFHKSPKNRSAIQSNSAELLIKALKNEWREGIDQFDEENISALRHGKLGAIIKKHHRLLPICYIDAVNNQRNQYKILHTIKTALSSSSVV